MLRYAQLRSNSRLLRCLTGLSAQDFAALLERFVPVWEAAERQRLSRPDRRYGLGGGRPYALRQQADKLLLTLAICRQGLTYAFAGLLFGLDESNARKLFLRVLPVLEAAADPQLARFLDQAMQLRQALGNGTTGSWQQLLERCPQLKEVAIDATEQPCRRPTRKRPRKRYYSGKRRRHTLKVQLVVAATGEILDVSDTYPGREADIAIYQKEGLPQRLPPPTKQFVDLGYFGLAQDYPAWDIRLPHKRKSPGRYGKGKKAKDLTRGQKQANTLRSKRRVIVENRLAAIKGYRLLADVWRSRASRHNSAVRAVAAVTNFRLGQRATAKRAA